MPKKTLAKEKKVVERKATKTKIFVKTFNTRKMRAEKNVKTTTPPTSPVDFGIDLDTPPHRITNCNVNTDQTPMPQIFPLIECQKSTNDEEQLETCVVNTDRPLIECLESTNADEKLETCEELLTEMLPIYSVDSMQRIEKFEKNSEMTVDETEETDDCEMYDDHVLGFDAFEDFHISHGSVADGKNKKDGAGKKITILSVDVVNPIQPAETVPNTDRNSRPQSPNHLNAWDIENAKIKIEELIDGGNVIWEEIVKRYNEEGSMSKRLRKAMIEAIVQYARIKEIDIDLGLMRSLSYQICKLFPTEIASVYFMPKTGKGYSGCLYNLYHRIRSNIKKEQKKRSQNMPTEPEIAIYEPTESVAVLKTDGHDDHVYDEKWNETFEYRQQKLSQYQTFDDFLNEWPVITKEIGFHLIKMDFMKVYGDRSISSHNWNAFFSDNAVYLMSNINEKGCSLYRKVADLQESPAKDAALSFILHYLLPPAYIASGWKPTCEDSQNTFLKFIKNKCIDTEIANRNKVCIQRGIKWHPYIIGQGRSKRKIKSFMVVVHSTKFPCKDFLTALEFCLYLYLLLDIPYPPESKAVWILVNRLFANVKVEAQMTPRIHQIINEIN